MASNVLAGIAGGLDGFVEWLKFRDAHKRQQERDEQQRQLHQLQLDQIRSGLETDQLQRQRVEQQLAQDPIDRARATLETNIGLKGIEGTLDDPNTLNLATEAGVTLPHRPYVKPVEGEMNQAEADSLNELMGIFPNTGIVKPPALVAEEAKRNLEIQKSRALANFMSGFMGQPGATSPAANLVDNPQARLAMTFMGLNPNNAFGPVRETPEEAASKAAAVAEARQPFQQALIDYAAKNRIDLQGDPYFNELLRTLSSIIPPVNEQTAQMVVEAAKRVATLSQAAHPRGSAPAGAPPPAPTGQPAGPPTMEQLLLQAKERFQTWEAVAAETSKPEVQARLKAAGIDPAVYLRKVQAYKILERLEGKK